MTATAALISRTWTVGKRFRVTLTIPRPLPGQVACAACEWLPAIPERMNKREQRDYYRGRDDALRELRELLHPNPVQGP